MEGMKKKKMMKEPEMKSMMSKAHGKSMNVAMMAHQGASAFMGSKLNTMEMMGKKHK